MCRSLPVMYWPLAVLTANFVRDRTHINRQLGIFLYPVFFNKVPYLSRLQIYGAKVFAAVPEDLRKNKFSPKAFKGKLVVFEEHCYWILVNGQVILSRDVRFINENVPNIKLTDEKLNIKPTLDTNKNKFVSISIENSSENPKEPENVISPLHHPNANLYDNEFDHFQDALDDRALEEPQTTPRLSGNQDVRNNLLRDYKTSKRSELPQRNRVLPKKLLNYVLFINCVKINVLTYQLWRSYK